MKLYYAAGACSLAPHIALRETGIDFEIEKVDLATKKTASGADYNTINPKGYVPALLLDNGQVLTEVPAVTQYIADQVPEKRLAPAAGSFERVRLQEWLGFIGSEIHKTFTPFWRPSPEETRSAARDRLALRYGWLETQLEQRSFLMGEHFTVADAYLFVVTRWLDLFKMPYADTPNLTAYRRRIAVRPAVQAALAAEGLNA